MNNWVVNWLYSEYCGTTLEMNFINFGNTELMFLCFQFWN